MIQWKLFRTLKRCWQKTDGVTIEPGGANRQWILSRALCHFAVFDLEPGLPSSKRMGALRIKLAEWAPFEDTGMIVSWTGSRALVWVWDKIQVENAIRQEGFEPRRMTILPETVIAAPTDDGARLRRALDGFEGEIWLDGRLVASRWWAQVPEMAAWIAFQRSSSLQGHLPDAAEPSPVEVSWLSQPWVTQVGIGEMMFGKLAPRQVAAAAAFVLALPLVYQGAQLVRLQSEQVRIEKALARAQAAATPVSADRTAAMEAMACSGSVAKLDPYPSQLHLLARVADHLSQPTITLSDWSFQSGDLRLTLAHSGQFDAAGAVRTFSAQPEFERVSGSALNDKAYAMSIKVRPRIAEAGQ